MQKRFSKFVMNDDDTECVRTKKQKRKKKHAEKNEWKVNYCHFSLRPHFAPPSYAMVRSKQFTCQLTKKHRTMKKEEKNQKRNLLAAHTDPPPFFHSFWHCVLDVMDFMRSQQQQQRPQSSPRTRFFFSFSWIYSSSSSSSPVSCCINYTFCSNSSILFLSYKKSETGRYGYGLYYRLHVCSRCFLLSVHVYYTICMYNCTYI